LSNIWLIIELELRNYCFNSSHCIT